MMVDTFEEIDSAPGGVVFEKEAHPSEAGSSTAGSDDRPFRRPRFEGSLICVLRKPEFERRSFKVEEWSVALHIAEGEETCARKRKSKLQKPQRACVAVRAPRMPSVIAAILCKDAIRRTRKGLESLQLAQRSRAVRSRREEVRREARG